MAEFDWNDPANHYSQLTVGLRVEKYTGEAQYTGTIVARYLTTRRKPCGSTSMTNRRAFR